MVLRFTKIASSPISWPNFKFRAEKSVTERKCRLALFAQNIMKTNGAKQLHIMLKCNGAKPVCRFGV
jgi:hypothetical protein